MTTHAHHRSEGVVRAAMTGVLLVFSFFIFLEILRAPLFLGVAGALSLCAIFLAKKTSQHFHVAHTHAGDSAVDIVAPLILFAANMLHPAIDGFSFHETLIQKGTVAAMVIAGGIVVHEIVRQSVLISAFRSMGIKWWWVMVTASIGIASGVGVSILGSTLLDRSQNAIDVATLVAYVFIIAEFQFSGHKRERYSKGFVFFGMVLGIIVSLFFKMH